MESNNSPYVHTDSIARIDEILAAKDVSFEEVKSIPARSKLTFTNGFYVNCTCLFIDLRNSSKLPDKHTRPTLAKIYRTYISECVAVINGDAKCSEVNIHGDAVWGVFDTPYQTDIDVVFSTAAQLSSLVDTLNCRYQKKGIDPIEAGIGMDYGRALMIKAGYSGSGINDVVWMGEVVNDASKLCSKASKWPNKRTLVSSVIYNNLNDHNKKLLTYNYSAGAYEGYIVSTGMEEWVQKNCK